MPDFKIVEEGPWRQSVIQLHTLYLEKLELLTERERDAFTLYFEHLAQPPYIATRKAEDYE